MSSFEFNIIPREVSIIKTNNRTINTKIPVPESLAFFEKIKKYESSNAIEQLPVVWASERNYQKSTFKTE